MLAEDFIILPLPKRSLSSPKGSLSPLAFSPKNKNNAFSDEDALSAKLKEKN